MTIGKIKKVIEKCLIYDKISWNTFLMGGSRKVKETLFCMAKDIRTVLIYYPAAVMTGFIGMLVYVMICKKI